MKKLGSKNQKHKNKLPLVCIVIVNWNGGEKIKQCISSLKNTSYKNYKVIVVDNGSTDNSINELKKINRNIDVIKLAKNFGYTIATNIGWRYALKNYNADYICAMDSDIITVQGSWLDLEISYLEKSDDYGISCGKLVFPDGSLQLLYFERASYWMNDCIDRGQYDFIKEVEGVGGACIIIKREVIEKIGYYDENFFYGPNDLDYCFRARKSGFKIIYNGLAKSIHNGSSSYLSSDRDRIFGPQSEGNIIYMLRHFGKLEGIKMILRQFCRIFITRRYPYKPLTWNNLNFQKNILQRSFILLTSVHNALRNYRTIKNGDYENFIIENDETK